MWILMETKKKSVLELGIYFELGRTNKMDGTLESRNVLGWDTVNELAGYI